LKKKKVLLKQSEDKLNVLKNLKPIQTEIQKLRTKIVPDLKNKESELVAQKVENEKLKSEIFETFQNSKRDLEEGKKLNEICNQIIKLNSDLNSLKVKIDREDKKLKDSKETVSYEDLLRKNETLRGQV
jgi:predicted  nucleic acid-binding Zn-ribbon protein